MGPHGPMGPTGRYVPMAPDGPMGPYVPMVPISPMGPMGLMAPDGQRTAGGGRPAGIGLSPGPKQQEPRKNVRLQSQPIPNEYHFLNWNGYGNIVIF